MNRKNEALAETAGKQAAACFGNGFHCAEAVAAAVLVALGEESAEATAHATAFGGGVACTFSEVCGAISGGLVAIGHLHGRREPGGDWKVPAELGGELRTRFIEKYGTTHCATLRDRFGDEAQMDECRKLVTTVAETLVRVLEKKGLARISREHFEPQLLTK